MAVDCFLKIDGIPGESRDDKHKNEIELLSWSWGISQAADFSSGRSGGGVGRAKVEAMSFNKFIDKSSAKILTAAVTGEHIKNAILTQRKAGGKAGQLPFLSIKMTDCFVSRYDMVGAGADGETVQERFDINFLKFEYEYAPQKEDGTKEGAMTSVYDMKLNK